MPRHPRLPTNPPPSPPILINPHEHRIIDTKHRDLVRVSVFGTSGFAVKDINPSTVELDGVHAVAHITRKIKRDEFPFADVRVRRRPVEPPGRLDHRHAHRPDQQRRDVQSQKDVLNIPDSARAFGRLKKYMGNASFLQGAREDRGENPSAVISVSNTPVTLASKNPAAHGIAKVKVNYTPP